MVDERTGDAPHTEQSVESVLQSDVDAWAGEWELAVKRFFERETMAVQETPQTQLMAAIEDLRSERDAALLNLSTIRHLTHASVSYLWAAVERYDSSINSIVRANIQDDSQDKLGNLTSSVSWGRARSTLLRHSREVKDSYMIWHRTSAVGMAFVLVAAPLGIAAWGFALTRATPALPLAYTGLLLLMMALIGSSLLARSALAGFSVAVRVTAAILPPVAVIIAVTWASLTVPSDVGLMAPAVAAGVVLVATVLYTVSSFRPSAILALGSPAEASRLDLMAVAGGSGVSGELERIASIIRSRARQEKRSALTWRRAHIALGVVAALSAGAAGVGAAGAAEIGVPDGTGGNPTPGWIAGLAIASAAAGGVATALNPGQRAEEKQVKADTCASLAMEVEILVRLDVDNDIKGYREQREALEDIIVRYEAVVGVPEHTSFWRRRQSARVNADK